MDRAQSGLVALCVGAMAAMVVTGLTEGEGPSPQAGAKVVSVAATVATLTTAPEPTPEPEPVSLDGVAPSVRRGVLVHDLGSGAELFAERPDEPFPTASVVKLLIALDVLDRGVASVRDVTRMLAASSDPVANRLWRPAIPRRWAAEIGLTGLVPPDDPNQWGGTRMTARDVVAVYRYVLASPHADVIVPALEAATPSGEDGVDQTFGIPDAAADRRWAVKQGWACCYDGLRVLNTTGVVDGRYVVAVLTGHDRSTGHPRAAASVTELVAALTPLFVAS
ncbi:hypothetical protein LZG04_40600 [Saccharothrix sp. S26]|uniref:serine hydrolase n=1 Tax=Saccharothrix sp. S26 TaxID=2907215 RepID=UPI001F4661A9|nr:serine hydrolase [Saccharothrix sp. S26]MCE7001076.1 hypothetical protein [Saccharothrix sp. S26]